MEQQKESASLESAFDSARLRTTILFVQVGCVPHPTIQAGRRTKADVKIFEAFNDSTYTLAVSLH